MLRYQKGKQIPSWMNAKSKPTGSRVKQRSTIPSPARHPNQMQNQLAFPLRKSQNWEGRISLAVHTEATYPTVWSPTTPTCPLRVSTAKLVLLQGILKGKFSGQVFLAAARALPYLKIPQPGPLVTAARLLGGLVRIVTKPKLVLLTTGQANKSGIVGARTKDFNQGDIRPRRWQIVRQIKTSSVSLNSRLLLYRERGREGATAIPTKDWQGPLTGGSLTVAGLGEGPAAAPTNGWAGLLTVAHLGGVACCNEDQWLSRTTTVIVNGWRTGCAPITGIGQWRVWAWNWKAESCFVHDRGLDYRTRNKRVPRWLLIDPKGSTLGILILDQCLPICPSPPCPQVPAWRRSVLKAD